MGDTATRRHGDAAMRRCGFYREAVIDDSPGLLYNRFAVKSAFPFAMSPYRPLGLSPPRPFTICHLLSVICHL